MKKILAVFLMMICASTFVFAEDDEEETSGSGFYFSAADTFCNPSCRLDSFVPSSQSFYTNGFRAEFGKFNSDEDGLIDIISDSIFGVKIGGVSTYTSDVELQYDNNYYIPDNDAFYASFYAKNDVGIQLNLFFVSFGGTIGLNAGYDILHQTAHTLSNNHNLAIYENTFFVNFMTGSYVSLNLGKTVKVLFNFDMNLLPIFNVQFDSLIVDNGKSKKTERPDINWFDQYDNDLSFGLSVVLFL